MSRRNKLEKFAELLTFANVYQNYSHGNPELRYIDGEIISRKGTWAQAHFGNENRIILELACGWGEYATDLARANPDANYIGVDVKGNRIWKGASGALSEGLTNVAFLRTRIEQIEYFFDRDEISEIWITFPDPFLRKSKSNRRLTAISFLERYHRLLPVGGILHLKTDSPELYEFSLESIGEAPFCEILHQNDDIYSKPLIHPALEIKTKYERMHLAGGRKIKYIQVRMLDR